MARPRVTLSRKGDPVNTNCQKKEFDTQIYGFVHCMKLWYHSMNIRCNEEKTFAFLKRNFNRFSLDQLPKIFKDNLATYFSIQMDQELPDVPEDHLFELIEPSFRRVLYRRWLRPRRKIRDLWNLLQCKVAANEVPQSMIKKAYEKHQSILSTIGETPEHVLQHVRSYARQFAQKTKLNYEEVIPIAPNKACYSHNREQGGSYTALWETKTRPKTRCNPKLNGKHTRIDPPTIFLQGPPGVGKSFLSNLIVKELSSRFGETPSVYPRNYASDHFDGYHGQLIFQIDDAFQKNDMKLEDPLFDQLIQMKSNNEYIVPMADLKDKGRKFTSEFVLLSSNLTPLQVCQTTTLIKCQQALLRRISPWWEIRRRVGNKYHVARMTTVNHQSSSSPKEFNSCYYERAEQIWYGELTLSSLVQHITNVAMNEHSIMQESAFLSIGERVPRKLTIPILPFNDFEIPSLAYTFPAFPPKENKVKAHAIPEPLKVRMITKGQSDLHCLKPLQRAMFKSLTEYSCFYPGTKNNEILEKINSSIKNSSGHYILSGDYESATDNLNMDIMKVFIEELCKAFSDHPILCRYLQFEGGQHIIEYPKWTHLDPILQTKGQLMGSLLSFPILCVANAATIGLALKIEDIDDVPAIINGDDILFTGSSRQINSWKRISRSMGLIPSIGKNYQSRFFGTINSQLIWRETETQSFKLLPTGKFKTILGRKGLCPKAAYEHGFTEADLILFNKEELKHNPKSFDIPIEFGGLGRQFNKEKHVPNRLDRRIYLQHLDELSDVQEIGRLDERNVSIVRGPKYLLLPYRKFIIKDTRIANLLKSYEVLLENEIRRTEVKNFRLNKKSLLKFQKNPFLREFLNKGDLETSLPLTLFSSETLALPTHLLPSINFNTHTRLKTALGFLTSH